MDKILYLGLISFLTVCGVSNTVHANDYPKKNDKVKKIADFLDIDVRRISMECPQNSFGIKGDGLDKSLYFCLSPSDANKRCELTISGLDAPPAHYQITFDVKQDAASVTDKWHSIMQIHSFPDFGEKWRCPPLSIEINKNSFRAYSRWDKSKISKTLGYNCSETGSSITAKELINNVAVKASLWNSLFLDIFATHADNGAIKLNINESSSELKNRGNLYNDKRAPYLKLGIYKPAGWTKSEVEKSKRVCISYKNFILKTSKAK